MCVFVERDYYPISVVPAVPYEGGIKFLHNESQIIISAVISEKIWKILEFCNGYNDIETISKLSKLPSDEVSAVISELVELELVVDSREQFMSFHKIRNYPTTFVRSLTQDEIKEYTASPRKPVKRGKTMEYKTNRNTFFSNVLEKRRSCRSFSDKKLTLEQIGSICHYAYCIDEHVVPSGGALYPLKLYVLIEENQEGIESGYYEYDAEKDRLVLFDTRVDKEQLKYCFNQEEMPFGSSVQIVIAADLKRQTFKYSNRGYMLTMIEAGHVAENISLYCAEQGLGACEMGGVQDEPLKNELELDEEVWPLIAIPVGYSSNSADISLIDKTHYVEEKTGSNKPIKEAWARAFRNDGSFFGAVSTYKDSCGNIQYAGATSTSYTDAIFKATIEGYERWLSSQVRIDYQGKATELKRWIDPRDYMPLTPSQAVECGVKPFTESLEIDWTIGTDYSGATIYIPSDLVYYGYDSNPEHNRIYFSHSSGIAAHTDYEEARKRAIIELIERDALMRNWYAGQPPSIICEVLLPVHAKKRVEHWLRYNRKMFFLQIPSDYGYVFETIIVSETHPFFVCGAAAAIEKSAISSAIIKSIQEAEYSLLLEINNPDESEIDPMLVSTPEEHGKVYHLKKNADTLSWLWNGKNINGFLDVKKMPIDELISELKIVTVDISGNDSDLKVVRAFSPKLIPINFGFYSAHYTHPELKGKVHPDSLKMPHYFA